MSYFTNFPPIIHSINDSLNVDKSQHLIQKLLVDITVNVRIRKEVFRDITLFEEYDIQDGETPDIISHKLYGTSQYHWVVMLANDMYNYALDFPMHNDVLEKYVIDKYSLDHVYDVHHWELNGLIVNPYTPGSTPISNIAYETRQNDLKRRIKIIHPSLIDNLVKQVQNLIIG